MTPFDTARVLTVKETAIYLHCHPSMIYRMTKAGTLPHFRVGSELRFREDVLDRWRLAQDKNWISGGK